MGGVGYVGYQFYQSHFGPAPDYEGQGNGQQVAVTIPQGATGSVIGQVLKKAGVVKSVDAFVAAQEQNSAGKSIQAGTYTLNKQMSAAAAVELMLSPRSKNNLIIAEGWRNTKIYTAIDERLKLKAGTTEGVAKKEWKSFGLPDWANSDKAIQDPLEGFLYPSSYPVAKGMKPEDVLKQMVDLAKQKYAALGIEAKAESLNLENPLQVLTVASLVQAEGKYKHDFEKVATVVYNRLKPDNTETYGLLDFDSTVNYLRGQSKLDTGSVDSLRQINNPYNTYKFKGLPPGPIDNPGDVAIKAPSSRRRATGTTSSRSTRTRPSSPRRTRSRTATATSTSNRRRRVNDGHRRPAPGRRPRFPIAHSLSPVLHRAAYDELGLKDWSYDRFEIDEAALPGSLRGSVPSGRVCR